MLDGVRSARRAPGPPWGEPQRRQEAQVQRRPPSRAAPRWRRPRSPRTAPWARSGRATDRTRPRALAHALEEPEDDVGRFHQRWAERRRGTDPARDRARRATPTRRARALGDVARPGPRRPRRSPRAARPRSRTRDRSARATSPRIASNAASSGVANGALSRGSAPLGSHRATIASSSACSAAVSPWAADAARLQRSGSAGITLNAMPPSSLATFRHMPGSRAARRS